MITFFETHNVLYLNQCLAITKNIHIAFHDKRNKTVDFLELSKLVCLSNEITQDYVWETYPGTKGLLVVNQDQVIPTSKYGQNLFDAK